MSIHCNALKWLVLGYHSKLTSHCSHFRSSASASLSPFGPIASPWDACVHNHSAFLECPSFPSTFSPNSYLISGLSIWLIQFCVLENCQELQVMEFGGHLEITETIYTKYRTVIDMWYWFFILSRHTSLTTVYVNSLFI